MKHGAKSTARRRCGGWNTGNRDLYWRRMKKGNSINNPTMESIELKQILEDHLRWLNNDGGKRADLRGADLQRAYLQRAYLQRADLRGADLRGADLRGVRLPDYQLCDGDLIVWKKGRTKDGFCLIKLLIPKEAKRTASLVGRKCRAEYADVLEITGADECDCWNDDFKLKYKVGERVYPDKYDDDPRVECTSGIHFFLTRKEAEEF